MTEDERVRWTVPQEWAPTHARKRRRGLRVLVIAVVVVGVGFAAFSIIGLIALVSDTSGGVSPLHRMSDIHAAFERAGIHCASWNPIEDEYSVQADAECALGGAGTASMATYRHGRSKYVPKEACPRIEGDAFWIDTSRIRDAALVRRMASAVDAPIVTDCPATTTTT